MMLIENTGSVSDQDKVSQKKPWHAPQCASKSWQTPRLQPLPFTETSGGTQSHKIETTGHAAS
jgi:hypothetical protein